MADRKHLVVGVDQHFNDDYKALLEKKYDLTIISFDKLQNYSRSEINLLVFTGGSDVDPSFYGEKVGNKTGIDKKRDEFEAQIYQAYHNTPKLGICRGAQFLTVMNDGKLIQHVNGHCNGNHKIETAEGQIFDITSTHHQMMFPYNLNQSRYELVAWSEFFKSDTYLNGENEEIILPELFLEPEIVYYNKSKSLCIQGHPEFNSCPEKTKNYILQLINKYLITN
jgi:GMP synthase-like glutamine amidotransferase